MRIPNRPVFASKASGGVLASFGSGLVTMMASIVLIPLNIATVGANQYGLWITISVTATLLHFSDLGIGTALVHYGSLRRANQTHLTPSGMLSSGISVIAAISIAACAIYILVVNSIMGPRFITAGLDAEQTRVTIVAGALIVAILALKPFESTLVGAGYLIAERRNQVLGAVSRIVLTLVACFQFGNLPAIALAEAAALSIPPLLSLIRVLRNRIASVRASAIRISTIKSLFGYSVRSFSVSLIGTVILQAGPLLLAMVGTPSMVTYYTAGFRVYSSVRQITSWTTDPFRSVLSQLWRSERIAAKNTLYGLCAVSAIAAVIGSTAIILVAREIAYLWLGQDGLRFDVPSVVTILLVGLMVNMLHVPFIPAMDAAGSPGAFLPLQLIWLIGFISTGYILGGRFGPVGVAAAMTGTIALLEYFYLRKALKTLELGWRSWAKNVLKPLLLATVPPTLLVTVAYAVLVHSSGDRHFVAVCAVLIYALAVCLNLFVVRKQLPFDKIRYALTRKL